MNIILKEISENNKEAALQAISKIASEATGIEEQSLAYGFRMREEQTSTGMIEGIAIPHTMQEINEPYLVVCKSSKIHDWETLDMSDVDLIIAIIAPKGGEEHLKLLSQISRKLISSENINALKQATYAEEVEGILGL